MRPASHVPSLPTRAWRLPFGWSFKSASIIRPTKSVVGHCEIRYSGMAKETDTMLHEFAPRSHENASRLDSRSLAFTFFLMSVLCNYEMQCNYARA